ncbi:hypothetical protein B0H14DRAFT_1173625 [Mycena olivaceomarginata]|nr:hypothetical protein B0H14DRAFT_1173625 [Mycena olivaceomarginata]
MFVLFTFSRLSVSRMCVVFPHHPCLSCSVCLGLSSAGRSACFSPSPIFVLLTFSCLLVSSDLLVSRKCVLFPHHPFLSCLLCLIFLSLGSVCFALPLYSQLHSFIPPIPIQIPYRKIWTEGLLETWDSR